MVHYASGQTLLGAHCMRGGRPYIRLSRVMINNVIVTAFLTESCEGGHSVTALTGSDCPECSF